MQSKSKISIGTLYTHDFTKFDDFIQVAESKCQIPGDFELIEVQDDIQQNGNEIIRLRYGRIDSKNNLYGEHYSIVLRKEDKIILGFVNLTLATSVQFNDSLPSQEETKALAKAFFNQFEPGFFDKLENLWIDRHEEKIEADNVDLIVAGTKFKCFIQEDDNYAWVVFGKDKQPIIFERNINWVNGRTTEKWLHDSYLETGTLDLHPVRTKQ